ncbi:MAG: hypothetical protein UY41_C0004G0007 [Candidatus Moranbacteria bacterium GW2011_GWE1_49_15]|nr:MAG: hypothetical protein UX75_C0005G0009 [Candidatus Moranbacteria bacterium GW2011_GWE2_47_10]KKW07390.1 MAG: hypothetical protein UY41_C0004G0007 [Candidatus Moranbacteria bacterium GW2011_GWE1_49_15]HBP00908.1 hypothetical protein [Candidatus Moranbacteria bacterium]
MKIFWKKYREGVVIFIYVAVVAGLLNFVAQPLFGWIKEKRIAAEERMLDQEIAQKKLREMPQLKEKVEIVKQEGERLDVFVDSDRALSLIESLEKLSNETGNEISIEIMDEGSDLGKAAEKKTKKKEGDLSNFLPGERYMTMRLKLAGDFNSTMKFLKRIENMQYFSDILSVKLSVLEKEDKTVTVTGPVLLGYDVRQTGQAKDPESDSVKYDNPIESIFEVVFYYED